MYLLENKKIMTIKNWGEFLKDVPTYALLSEIENRNNKKYDSVSDIAAFIMKDIDEAITMFGTYTFDDNPYEVMDIDSIMKKLKDKPIKEIGSILSEVLDKYPNSERSTYAVNTIIDEFESLPDDKWYELLSLDDRFKH